MGKFIFKTFTLCNSIQSFLSNMKTVLVCIYDNKTTTKSLPMKGKFILSPKKIHGLIAYRARGNLEVF